uniref:Uncharacterized protein n=1 Tax=Rhizophora mucronata TaxID=61149 RepID=A0A2P2R4T3_RHIMU
MSSCSNLATHFKHNTRTTTVNCTAILGYLKK